MIVSDNGSELTSTAIRVWPPITRSPDGAAFGGLAALMPTNMWHQHGNAQLRITGPRMRHAEQLDGATVEARLSWPSSKPGPR